jgi:hypothetical protein
LSGLGFVREISFGIASAYQRQTIDMEIPNRDEICQHYAEIVQHLDNIVIHYDTLWSSAYYRLSIKDSTGVYQPFASVDTCISTSNGYNPNCFMDVYIFCAKTGEMVKHTVEFNDKDFNIDFDTYDITKIILGEIMNSEDAAERRYVFHDSRRLKQVFPETPIKVAWLT